MNIKEWIIEHKTGVVIAGAVFVAYMLIRQSGNKGAVSDGSVNAGALSAADQQNQAAYLQIQMASINANSQANQVNAQAGVASKALDVQALSYNLQSTDTLAALQTQMAIQTHADTLSAQTTQSVSALQAQVAENTVAADVAKTQINAKAYVDIATLPYMNLNAQQTAQLNALYAGYNAIAGQTNSNTANIVTLTSEEQSLATHQTDIYRNINSLNEFAGSQTAFDKATQSSIQRVSTNISANLNQQMLANPLASNVTAIPVLH